MIVPTVPTEKEQKLLDHLQKISRSVPFGEVLIRLIIQDGVVIRSVVEETKPSTKY